MRVKIKIIASFIIVFLLSNFLIAIYSVKTVEEKAIEAAQERLISDLNLGLELLGKENTNDDLIKETEKFMAKAFVYKKWSQSSYEEIINKSGQVIGKRYVAGRSNSYDDMLNEFKKKLIYYNVIAIILSSLAVSIVIQKHMKALEELKNQMSEAEKGDLKVSVDVRGNDEFVDLANSFNSMIASLNKQASGISKLSEGELDVSLIPKSSNDTLSNSFNIMSDTLKNLSFEIDKIIKATKEGKLSIRADYRKFHGKWRELILGINEILDLYAKPIELTTHYVKKIGDGDIPSKITEEYYGDFNNIKESLNTCISAMNLLLCDTELLIYEAIEGKLDARASVDSHRGDYKEIVLGMNKVLDAVSTPIKEASIVLDDLSKGKLSSKVRGEYKGDHNAIKKALNDTTEEISDYINDISQTLEKIAKGDMDNHIMHNYLGDFKAIKNSINYIIDVFNGVLLSVSIVSDEVSSKANSLSKLSEILEDGALKQAKAIHNLSMSIDHIAFDSRSISNNSSMIKDLSSDIKEDIIKASGNMDNMLLSIEEIEKSSLNISKVITLIDEIAGQTNRLATSAYAEASRAGIYGKAFAMVADQVRELALRSSYAVSETSKLIEESKKKVDIGGTLARKTASDLELIVAKVTDVAEDVLCVSDDLNQHAKKVAETNHSLVQISKVTKDNLETSNMGAFVSKDLLEQANQLDDIVSKFNLKKENGLHIVKKNRDN